MSALAAERVVIRPLEPSDRDRLCALYDRMSPRTRRRRFNAALPPSPSPALLDLLMDVDGRDKAALVAADGEDVVGVVRYAVTGEDPGTRTAEVGIVVEDAWQRRRLGTGLLSALLQVAARNGIDVLEGTTAFDNEPLLRLVYAVAPEAEIDLRLGLYEYDLRLPVAAAAARAEVSSADS
jgi:acetyltransferase